MKKAGSVKEPTFFWQGLLIILPVIVLAAVGLYSLRQDKLLAENQARERAQELATDALNKIFRAFYPAQKEDPTVIGDGLELDQLLALGLWFNVTRDGKVAWPPPVDTIPNPQVLDFMDLTPAQTKLWLDAQTLIFGDQDRRQAIGLCTQLLESSPPPRFLGHIYYSLGMLHLKAGDMNAAKESFRQVLARAGKERGETGIPLAHLALLRLLEFGVEAGHLDNLPPKTVSAELEQQLADVRIYASPVTPQVLAAADRLQLPVHPGNSPQNDMTWLAAWQRTERSRKLYQTLSHAWSRNTSHNSPMLTAQSGSAGDPAAMPRLAWIQTEEEESWLATRFEHTNGLHFFVCYPSNVVQQKLQAALKAGGVPPYFGLDYQIAGLPVGPSNDLRLEIDGLKTRSTLATARKSDAGHDYLVVNVHLVNPPLLYGQVRARQFGFMLLIGASAAAALVGFTSARRAFYRQHQLATMKTNFVSSVSHELRAPIASMRLMAEGLERGKIQEPSKQREYFKFIVQECRRLSALVENVLDFSRIEQGRKQYEFEPTDLKMLVEQTTALMAPSAEQRQIRLECSVPAEAVSAEVDGRALQQALVNLIDNALKHSPNNGLVKVILEFSSDTSLAAQLPTVGGKDGLSRTALLIRVEDHGPGIPAEDHERIFERFYRRGSELRRETQGVGIGLSIVKHIVEAHGGRVLVQSAEGQGSRFTIVLRTQIPQGGTGEH